MGKKPVIHIEAAHSFWSGKSTALCGQMWKGGEYHWYPFSRVTCPSCKRLDKQRKKGGRK